MKRLPIDRLKIDQSFVREIISGPGDAAIAIAVASLARSLDLDVIAEGVETDAQLAFLKRKGCYEIQGYLFSPPIPPEDMTELLATPCQTKDPVWQGPHLERSVLFLDDDPGMLLILERALDSEGYKIYTAESADQAFDLFAKHYIQVVVADFQMPNINGTEFLRRIKTLSSHTIRIMLGGNSDMETVINAVNSGAIYQFIEKPISRDNMRNAIRKAFSVHAREHAQYIDFATDPGFGKLQESIA